jgi:hypothetical protein
MTASYPIHEAAGKPRVSPPSLLAHVAPRRGQLDTRPRAWPLEHVAREGEPRIFTFGFSADESAAIDAALAEIRVPAPTRLKPSQAGCRVGDIVDRDADGCGSFDWGERLVLFARLPGSAVGQLVDFFRSIGVPRPIFATVTETSATWTLAELLEHLAEEKRAHEAAREASP